MEEMSRVKALESPKNAAKEVDCEALSEAKVVSLSSEYIIVEVVPFIVAASRLCCLKMDRPQQAAQIQSVNRIHLDVAYSVGFFV
jgi:hypothetical protein